MLNVAYIKTREWILDHDIFLKPYNEVRILFSDPVLILLYIDDTFDIHL